MLHRMLSRVRHANVSALLPRVAALLLPPLLQAPEHQKRSQPHFEHFGTVSFRSERSLMSWSLAA